MHLKRLDGELIIGGDKDDWRPLIPQQLRHIKPIQHRHLDIEEQQIRLQFTRHPDHLLAVDRLTHHLHSITELLKQQSHPVSCGLLIICHEDPQSGISLFHEPEFLKSLCCLQQTSWRSEEHTSELQSRGHLVCRLLLEKKKHDDRENEAVMFGKQDAILEAYRLER